MADVLTSQVIQDGGHTAILKFTNVSDGSGQAAAVLVDVSTLSADPVTKQACTGVTLQAVTFSNIGMGVELLWDATTNVPLLNLPQDWEDTMDFSDYGIPNDAGVGKTGDIVVTTVGATAADTYLLILTLTKTYFDASV
jgi:hypothetical protein|tara:strand:- start:1025 stop:1441 length:417 start_codon:yes stop_codon:yes gene_type:complete